MHYRQDALVAAADVISQIRRILSTLDERTVGTTGYIDAKPNSINIIPDEVTFTWGFWDPSDDVIEKAEREGVEWEYEDRMRASAVQSAADDLDYDSMRIFSGAGHDATHMHSVCDTGMVFAVSENGKSQNESEYTSWDDCYSAASTIANAAIDLAGGAR